MIEYKTEKQEVERKVPTHITCDICGTTYSYEDDVMEMQEFTCIRKRCGYSSVFGDGDVMEVDICQHCLKEKLGEYMRLNEQESN